MTHPAQSASWFAIGGSIWTSHYLHRLGLLAAIGVGAWVAPVHADPLDLSRYVLTFEDTFRTLDVSAHGPGTRWIAHTPWGGDFGDARFEDPGASGPFAATPDGLTITAHKDADGKWHSGLLSSRDRDGPQGQGFAQRYGYFEIRTRLPTGAGTWPAFWLIGVDKSVSASEIDVIEYYGKFSDCFHSVTTVWQTGNDRAQNHLTMVPKGSLTDKFNTFGVLIDPRLTHFYLNREEVWNTATPPEYRQPMYMLVDLALGGGWPIADLQSPTVMAIEYIKVWRDLALRD
ncbi:glycoside hydrolase family 16 protein [Beijerinckia sp. L45]|uniref:glycoside hydrolase family 16 protein n=1 Tax=Beijerinckia sp. L45 TaxID=1641855 RepID=UPI00131AEFCC|nr:glycoside hydrolase family 16 protein [Beijerinckia sp. L45]